MVLGIDPSFFSNSKEQVYSTVYAYSQTFSLSYCANKFDRSLGQNKAFNFYHAAMCNETIRLIRLVQMFRVLYLHCLFILSTFCLFFWYILMFEHTYCFESNTCCNAFSKTLWHHSHHTDTYLEISNLNTWILFPSIKVPEWHVFNILILVQSGDCVTYIHDISVFT